MIKTKEEFIKICSDQKFWQWINNKSYIPYEKITDKEIFLTNIYKKIAARTYYPKPPKEYLSLNKGHGVVRIIPSFQLEDLCVYYYCVRKLERFIAVNHVPGTYGGFGIHGELRRIEEDEIKNIKNQYRVVSLGDKSYVFSDGGYMLSSMNSDAWKMNWGDFNSKLYFNCNSKDEKFEYATELDISNFYDSIQLDNLEYKIRKYVKNNLNDVVYLLMHFLRFWNRHVNFYRQQGAGIPQDAFGECSRIIANFYLQDYDKEISSYCKKKGCNYFRYADDQIIFTHNKSEAIEIVSKASSLLMREGLNFNQKKVNIMSIKLFKKYFCFDNFFALKPNKNGDIDRNVLNKQIKFYLKNRILLRKKGLSLFRRILSVLINCPRKPSNFLLLKKLIISEEFLLNNPLNADDLAKIYSILRPIERKKFIKFLDIEISSCLYSDRLYNLYFFYKKIKINVGKIRRSISRTKKFYNLVT